MELEDQPDKTIEPLLDKSFLFNHQSLNRYKEAILKGIDLVQKKMSSVDKPFSGVLPHELAPKFEGVDLDQSFDRLSKALEEVEELYLNHAIYFHHPKYVAHLNCPIVVPAILAELILTSINSSLDTWDQSAGGTFIEQKLIDWTAEKIGLGTKADGIFTSGGTQSNLMAMLLARDSYCSNRLGHNIQAQGLPAGYHKLRIFTSQASHFSVQKSAAILGLGYESVVSVPCDDQFRMDARELEREIKSCFAQDLKPMAVVATVGTTDFGSIDPLMEIAEICHDYGLWMHADAAYGCGLLLSERYKHLLFGIQSADSVTVDYHKSFFQPVSCGAFFVRNRKNLSFVTHHAEYLNPLSHLKEGTPNLVNKSIQTTRRFDALKLWLTLRTMGADNIGRAFDRVVDLAQETYRLLLAEETLEVLHRPELSTLAFRYRPSRVHSERRIDEVNAYIRKALFRSGEAVIAGSKVNGRQYLKFTLLNPTTTIADIQEIIGLIKHHGQQYFNCPPGPQEVDHD
ncbi:MAG TPA: aspartate aminotransferase family protein [Blastocatellia bacterium]|nr:aspartate aminotransferase family protein [Blastocatellia bacterium]